MTGMRQRRAIGCNTSAQLDQKWHGSQAIISIINRMTLRGCTSIIMEIMCGLKMI